MADQPLIYLIVEDPPRSGDTPEVARIKATAAAEAWAARLRAAGEPVTLAPFGRVPETGDAA